MAGEWLKFEKATPDKPEVFAIAMSMGIDPDAVVGKLLRVWSWFDTHTEGGNAKSVTSAFLDRIAGAVGFSEAMESVGWLLIETGAISLPAFDKHTGQTAKSRAETARRVSQHRAGGKVKRESISRPIRADIAARDGNACVYCSRKQGQYTPPELSTAGVLALDHVIPLSRGGTDDASNLVCACSGCNMFKSDRTPDECGLRWPIDKNGNRYGNSVTGALPREEKRREEKEQKQQPAAVDFFPGLPPQLVADFAAIRKLKKAPITQTAVDGLRREATKAGLTLEAALAVCCERGWAAYKADWPGAIPQHTQAAASVPGGGRKAL